MRTRTARTAAAPPPVKAAAGGARPSRRRYTLLERCFRVIDTPAAAYWLGFVASDGYVGVVRGRPYYLRINLKAADAAHLRSLADFLGTDAPVTRYVVKAAGGKRYPACRLTVYSALLAADLARHGVTTKKSLSLRPCRVRDDLKRHYWRGVIDGDGWVCAFSPRCKADGEAGSCDRFGLGGTPAVVAAFGRYARSAGATGGRHDVCGRIDRLAYGSRDAVYALCDRLYGGDARPALARKAAVAGKILAARTPPAARRAA